MKRIVKRTTTVETWHDPADEDDERRSTAEDEDEIEEDGTEDLDEDEPKRARRHR